MHYLFEFFSLLYMLKEVVYLLQVLMWKLLNTKTSASQSGMLGVKTRFAYCLLFEVLLINIEYSIKLD